MKPPSPIYKPDRSAALKEFAQALKDRPAPDSPAHQGEAMKHSPETASGYYIVTTPDEPTRTLVYLYRHVDFGADGPMLAYGAQDGGGFMPLHDLRDDCELIPVTISRSAAPMLLTELDNIK